MNPGFRFFGPRWRDWWRRMLKGVDVRIVVLFTIVAAVIAFLANAATIATFVMSFPGPSTPPPESSRVSVPPASDRGPSLSRDVWNSEDARRALRLLREAETHYETETWASALQSYRQAYDALPTSLKGWVNAEQLNRARRMSTNDPNAEPQAAGAARKALEAVYLELKNNEEVVR